MPSLSHKIQNTFLFRTFSKFQDGVAGESPTEEAVHIQNDGHILPDRDLFIDNDEGSGVDNDESSGSGWGAGPGPDDEDARSGGSGDGPDIPEDDEDYVPTINHPTNRNPSTDRKLDSDYDFSETPESPQTPETPVVPETPVTVVTPVTEPPIPDPDVAICEQRLKHASFYLLIIFQLNM